MAGRRRTRKHDEDLSPRGPVQRADSDQELAGPRRTDSPQAGVARLAGAAGNEAVAGMLQRFRAGDDEETDDGGGGAQAPEPLVQQEEEPPQQSGGDRFQIGENVDGGGGAGGDRFQIGENVDGGGAAGGDRFQIGENVDGGGAAGGDRFQIGENVDGGARQAEQESDAPREAERQSRAERAEGQAGGAAAQVPAIGPVVGINAAQLKAFAAIRLQDADGPTRDMADGLCDAVATSWVQWQLSAIIAGVNVNGVAAVGGQLVGPPLGPLIASNGAGVDADAARALGSALGAALGSFQASFSIAGLPLFPSFAAVPSPQAPPTPSVPMPLLSADANTGAFSGAAAGINLRDPRKQQAASAVAGAMSNVFPIWLGGAQFQLLGSGPVPTFAPPYVPVGPVVGGQASSLPGGISG